MGNLVCTAASKEDYSELEPRLAHIAAYLSGVSTSHLSGKNSPKTRQKTKRFAV